MLRSGRRRVLGGLAIVPLALAACGHDLATPASTAPAPNAALETTAAVPGSASPIPSTTPSPTPAERLDAELLAERITRAELASHLVALHSIVEAHGGHRATGSEGFEAAAAYAAGVLEAAGYRVARRSFEVDGVTGTNLLVERSGASSDVVMIGAHLDTVVGSPGMNDNGSGVAAVLTIAEALAELPPPHHTVRLALWDAEENGPFGSRAYVASLPSDELARIGAYVNLDMIGAPNPLRFVYAEADAAPGSEAITAAFAATLEREDLAWEPIDLGGASDHGPFIAAGIPTGGVFGGGHEPVTEAGAARFGARAGVPADACVHLPCDTLDNVDPEFAAELARAAAAVLAALAGEPSS